jgi:mRNA interferase MazF
MTSRSTVPMRGEIWEVRFDPSEGDEIKKTRPAVVMSIRNAGRMELHVVAPITGWQTAFETLFWMIRLSPTPVNGLSKESSADAFQVKSVSVSRFRRKLGSVTPDDLDDIATAIAICVGYKPTI